MSSRIKQIKTQMTSQSPSEQHINQSSKSQCVNNDISNLDANTSKLYNESEVARIAEQAAKNAISSFVVSSKTASNPNLDNSIIQASMNRPEEVDKMPSSYEKKVRLSNGEVIKLRGRTFDEAIENALQKAWIDEEQSCSKQFADYANEWFELFHKPNCSPRWLKESRLLLDKHILPFFKGKMLNEITVSDIQAFFNGKANLSLSTNKHIRYLLNGIFESALEDNFITRNVMGSKRLTIRGSEKTREALTLEQVQDICRQFPKLSLQDRLLLSLLMYTGMRRGEILALHWKYVDLDNGMIHVRQSVDYPDGNTPFLKPPKSKAGIRDIPILPQLEEVLTEAKKQATGCYLIGDDDQPLTKRAYQWMFRNLQRQIDLHGATAHVFRHTFITMSSCYLDPKTLQSIAGHSKCDITLNRYAHAQQEQIAKAGKKLIGIYAAS